MGSQFIFVVETNKKCQSDWIYIKDTIEQFYSYNRTQVKLNKVYMDGKGNYKKKQKEIQKQISQYGAASKSNHSKVIYCFDCDNYDSDSEAHNFLEDAQKYCAENGHEFVWFCKDIEQVYLGKQVEDAHKKAEAAAFKNKKLIMNIRVNQLSGNSYRVGTSNLMCVLDQFEEFARKE